MMKNKLLNLIYILFIPTIMYSQNVGIGTEKPAKSALLELNSTDKGFLLPRLTENQKALIKSPAEGLMIYQVDSNIGVYLFQSGNWRNLGASNTNTINEGNTALAVTAYTPNYLLTSDGNGAAVSSGVYVNPTNGFVGFGNTSPSSRIDVDGTVAIKSGYFGGGTLKFKYSPDDIKSRSWVLANDFYYTGDFALFQSTTQTGNSYDPKFYISKTGKVGIGSVDPQALLEVGGTVGIKSGLFGGGALKFNYAGSDANSRSWILSNDYQYSGDFALFQSTTQSGGSYDAKFYISKTGNVGIGIVDPASKLDINGMASIKSGYYGGGALKFKSTLDNADSRSWLLANDYYYTGDFALFQSSTQTGSTYIPKLYISKVGKVGIGKVDPQANLDVEGSIKQSSILSSLIKADSQGNLVNATPGTDFVTSSSSTVGSIAKFTAKGTIANSSISELSKTNASEVKLDSKSAGYLAIGDFSSVSPMAIPTGYRLVVQDGIITEKLKVALRSSQTDWADYVFAPEYKLLTLSEVEEFINENKHLPNVPSAKQMSESGIDIAKTSKMFMEKIEELTLYLIELKKEIEILKKENN